MMIDGGVTLVEVTSDMIEKIMYIVYGDSNQIVSFNTITK